MILYRVGLKKGYLLYAFTSEKPKAYLHCNILLIYYNVGVSLVNDKI